MKILNQLASVFTGAAALGLMTACNGTGVSVNSQTPTNPPLTTPFTFPDSNPTPAPSQNPPVVVIKPVPIQPAPAPSPDPTPISLNDILKSLSGTPHFASLIASNNSTPPKKATSLANTHYLACAGATRTIYLDLSRSDLANGNFKAIGSFTMPAKKTSGMDPRSAFSNKLLANKSSVEGGTSIDMKSLDFYAPNEVMKLSYHQFPNGSAILQATRAGEFEEDPFTENMICDGYSTNYFAEAKGENLFYQCDGTGSPYFQFNRTAQLANMVGYSNEMDLINPITSSDSNYWGNTKWLIETDSNGNSISALDPVTVGGILQMDDQVNYQQPSEEPFDYVRIYKADWTSILANSPASFSVTALENAPIGIDEDGNELPEPTSTHTCTRAQ